MQQPSLEIKKAYFAKHRQSNYSASLRLEGFKISPQEGDPHLPTRKAALEAIRHVKV
ncbi:DUF2559 family protein [Alcaligenaceae bacterium]|nr:DUF2559 family protein [Alcaligenaceae bacterium]